MGFLNKMDDKTKFETSMTIMESAQICARLESCSENMRTCLKEISMNKWGPGNHELIITKEIENHIAKLKELTDMIIKEIIANQNNAAGRLATECNVDDFMGFCTTSEAGNLLGTVADAATVSIGKMTEETLKKIQETSTKNPGETCSGDEEKTH